ncbi:MAG TPA: glycosyltransferase [Puia sp.]|nr:glycosyltransferase [Puia sp.]
MGNPRKTEEPRYGVILPVRNGGQYVKECVGSIISQSLPGFDLLVLDNCSTDGTLEWLQSLSDQRIKLYPADRPLSIEENWGRIVSIPKNEFITLIGHDDILDPWYLETMDSLIRRHPEAGLYQAHFRYIDSQGATIRKCKPMDERQSSQEFLSFFLAGLIDNMGTGYMMRSAHYDEAGGIPPYPNLLFADFELWIRLSLRGYKATAFRECFAFRQHQSTTTTSADSKYHLAFERFIGYLEQLVAEQPAMLESVERYGPTFLLDYCKGLSHRLLRTPLRKRNGKRVAAFIADCQSYGGRLFPDARFDPYRLFSLRLAREVDRWALTRALFLLFKRVYPKPVIK